MKQGFFQEDNGNFSMTRLVMFLVTVVALSIAEIAAWKLFWQQPLILTVGNSQIAVPMDYGYILPVTALVTALLGLAFGIKAVNKAQEEKVVTPPEDLKQP